MSRSVDFESLAWREKGLAECLPSLLAAAGLTAGGILNSAPSQTNAGHDPGPWVESAARHLGCEARTLHTKFRNFREQLTGSLPCLIELRDGLYLAVMYARKGQLALLRPDRQIERITVDELCDALRQTAQDSSVDELLHLLNGSRSRAKRRSLAADLLLDEQAGDRRLLRFWVFSQNQRSKAFTWLRQMGALQNGAALIAAHVAQYVLWLAAWALIGRLSLAGHMDHGWLLCWFLLLATVVPCRVLVTWLGGLVSIDVGAQLKRRLLHGSLRLLPEEVRLSGIGSFLAQAFEAEALERLALGGGVTGLLAIVDLFVAGFLLGNLAVVLAGWFAISGIAGYLFLRRYALWSNTRLSMTNDLVESMVGYRTRLAQQKPEQWHEAEDGSLSEYLNVSGRLDRAGLALVAGVPRGWVLAALVFFAPVVISGRTSTPKIAVTLGGILLAYAAFDRLASSFSELAAAFVAWVRVAPLFQAAQRSESLGELACVTRKSSSGRDFVLEADKLAFRYKTHAAPVLQSCSLAIKAGDRILLEGPSGGGKTTFASLLSGIRQSESGLLLSRGLDQHTVGAAGWRERVVSVPQFHENHLLTDTLAANLLMGRRGTPTAKDFEEAASVCQHLGLGPLLERMPSGLLQMVGDGGWQLSHGERSRVFIARALLQDSDLTILDESFGALDPENLQVALRYTIEKANTLVVIAHP